MSIGADFSAGVKTKADFFIWGGGWSAEVAGRRHFFEWRQKNAADFPVPLFGLFPSERASAPFPSFVPTIVGTSAG